MAEDLQPIEGWGKLGRWINKLLERVDDNKPVPGKFISVSQTAEGKSIDLQNIAFVPYYVVINGVLKKQPFLVSGQPIEPAS